MEAEKTDLRRQLAEERKEANKAIADAQAAQAEAKVARAEGSLAHQRAEELEARFNALRSRVDKADSSTRAEIERTHTQFVDAYRELGAQTAVFEVPDQEAGLRFLEWLQEELLVLPTIMTGFMSFTSLVTCEGGMNALSCEGCRHYEVFDQADENFEREIFKVEDPVVKQSTGALFDRMWGPHGREAVRDRSDRAIEQVKAIFCVVVCVGMCGFAKCVCCCCRWLMPKTSRTLLVWMARRPRPRRLVRCHRRMPMKAPRRPLRPLWPAKAPHQPLRRRAKLPRRWWPSRLPKTPQSWQSLRRWLNRC
jgi:hypothetical protein